MPGARLLSLKYPYTVIKQRKMSWKAHACRVTVKRNMVRILDQVGNCQLLKKSYVPLSFAETMGALLYQHGVPKFAGNRPKIRILSLLQKCRYAFRLRKRRTAGQAFCVLP